MRIGRTHARSGAWVEAVKETSHGQPDRPAAYSPCPMIPRLFIAVATAAGLFGPTAPLSAAPRVPFGSHPQSYAPGTRLPSAPAAERDRAVTAYFTKWRTAYLVPVGRSGWKAVRSPDAEFPFVAEAQGFGLEILAVLATEGADTQNDFDAVLAYILAHPSSLNRDLMAAEQNKKGGSVNGADSATDGDITIAYGLLLADRQWGSEGSFDYRRLALTRIAAIKKSAIDPETKLPLLGDWAAGTAKYAHATRTSDFLIGHFRAFRTATGDGFWDEVIDACLNLIVHLQKTHAPATGLVPDFVVETHTSQPRPAPPNFLEGREDGAYSWNATRVPWRLGADAALHGTGASRGPARLISDWLERASQGRPEKIRSGYSLGGSPLGPPGEPAFFATVGPAASVGSSQAWVDALWKTMTAEAARPKIASYYGASLLLQSLIVLSGNSWDPSLPISAPTAR